MSEFTVFEDLNDFFHSCRLDYIAQMKLDHKLLIDKGKSLQTQEPKLTTSVELFLKISFNLLEKVEYYSQDSGIIVLEWLSEISRLLETTGNMINEGVGYLIKNEVKSVWPFDFSGYTLLTILERTKRFVQRNKVTLKHRHSLAREIRERTLLALTKMFFYFLMILCVTINVKEEREPPTRILEITSEALSEIR